MKILWAAVPVAAALSLASCNSEGKHAPPPKAPPAGATGLIEIPPDSPKLKQIRVVEVREQEMPTDEFTAPGKVEVNPNRVSKVLLPAPGRVSEVLVRFGDAVNREDPLLTLESPEADAAA